MHGKAVHANKWIHNSFHFQGVVGHLLGPPSAEFHPLHLAEPARQEGVDMVVWRQEKCVR